MQKYKFTISIILVLLVSFSSYGCSSNISGGKDLKSIQTKTFSLSGEKALRVKAVFGDVHIQQGNSSEVKVIIRGNDEAVEKVDFNFSQDGEEVLIEAEKKGMGSWWSTKGAKLRFEITAPSNFNLNISSAGGDLSVKSISGDINLKTSGGDISLKESKGNIKASTSGGDVDIDNIDGNVSVATSGGDIKGNVHAGNLSAKTSGGDINLNASDVKIDAKTSGGDIKLNYTGVNKGVELATSGGDIELFVPADFNASVILKTGGGRVKSDFEGSRVKKISSQSFEADLNNGGEKLSAKTGGGNIKLSKR